MTIASRPASSGGPFSHSAAVASADDASGHPVVREPCLSVVLDRRRRVPAGPTAEARLAVRRPRRLRSDSRERQEALVRQAEREQRQRERLESRIAQVKRWMGAALADGRAVEAAFIKVADEMDDEEREEFLRGFLESCGAVVRDTGRRLRRAIESADRQGGEHVAHPR